jgi:SHS2 domain-containing protein
MPTRNRQAKAPRFVNDCKIYLSCGHLTKPRDLTYRYLEHTADVGVEVVAPSLRDAFSEAGIALYGIMTDTSGFKPKASVRIAATGYDLKSLLYSWLEELIYIFDTSRMVLARIDVDKLSLDPPAIEATGWGEIFDPARHESRTGVKAITYHRMELEDGKDRCIIRYFVDI